MRSWARAPLAGLQIREPLRGREVASREQLQILLNELEDRCGTLFDPLTQVEPNLPEEGPNGRPRVNGGVSRAGSIARVMRFPGLTCMPFDPTDLAKIMRAKKRLNGARLLETWM
jgi:hypothetical protein